MDEGITIEPSSPIYDEDYQKYPERDEVVDLINWIQENPGKTAALLRNLEESELVDRGNRRTGTITQFLDKLRDEGTI